MAKLSDSEVVRVREVVLDHLGDGLSAAKACERAGITYRVLKGWLTKDKAFFDEYMAARKIGVLKMVDEIVDISDNRDEDSDERYENVHRAKLMVDTRKWLLAKLLPDVFGDGPQVQQNISGGQVMVVTGVPRAPSDPPKELVDGAD